MLYSHFDTRAKRVCVHERMVTRDVRLKRTWLNFKLFGARRGETPNVGSRPARVRSSRVNDAAPPCSGLIKTR